MKTSSNQNENVQSNSSANTSTQLQIGDGAQSGLQAAAYSVCSGTNSTTANAGNNNLNLSSGELTTLGEGSDAQTSHVHWPDTKSSGVTLGKGYDIGSRSQSEVIQDLTAAGMSVDQATKISKGCGLKGAAAGRWVNSNKNDVGRIASNVQRELLAQMLVDYTASAKSVATSTRASKDKDGFYTNARGREIKDRVEAGSYVMTSEQWNALHPAMIELLTDLKYQGGSYLYDRVAKINSILIEHHGNQLEQFKALLPLFESDTSELSYMDKYTEKVNGGHASNRETFFGQSANDISGTRTRRNRVRISFLKKVIAALEAGQTVNICSEDGTPVNENQEQTVTTPDLGNATAHNEARNEVNNNASSSFQYTVLKGESLSKLSAKHNVSIESIKNSNRSKLHKWGKVVGFYAGETITIVRSGKTESNVEDQKKDDTDYPGLAKVVYDAMFSVFYGTGLGTDEDAIYAAFNQLEKDQTKINQFIATYKSVYGRNLVSDIRSEFYDYLDGDHSQKALDLLNLGGGAGIAEEKEVVKENENEEVKDSGVPIVKAKEELQKTVNEEDWPTVEALLTADQHRAQAAGSTNCNEIAINMIYSYLESKGYDKGQYLIGSGLSTKNNSYHLNRERYESLSGSNDKKKVFDQLGVRNNQSRIRSYDEGLLERDDEWETALNYVQQNLQNGIPTLIGIDHTYSRTLSLKGKNSSHSARTYNEGTTDHWIVAVGCGIEDGKKYISYFDPGRGSKGKRNEVTGSGGNEEWNRLYQSDKDGEEHIWHDSDGAMGGVFGYTLTAVTKFNQDRPDDKYQVQKELKRLGYYSGGIDGAIGRNTIAAIKKFQGDNNLPQNGSVNATLLNQLQESQQ